MQVSPSTDMQVSPSTDMQVSPSTDMQVSPSTDMQYCQALICSVVEKTQSAAKDGIYNTTGCAGTVILISTTPAWARKYARGSTTDSIFSQ